MCRLFIEGDAALWECHTRSLRLNGLATSLRLETFFWNILAEIAGRDGLTLSQLVAKLYDELVEARGEAGNFASFLKSAAAAILRCRFTARCPRTPQYPFAASTPRTFCSVSRQAALPIRALTAAKDEPRSLARIEGSRSIATLRLPPPLKGCARVRPEKVRAVFPVRPNAKQRPRARF